jgi:hypothetical protein
MSAGGNKAMTQFFEQYGINLLNHMDKYSSVAAVYYRRRLKAKVEGTPFDE